MVELRQTSRASFETSVEFSVNGRTERIAGHARDISLGGMFVVAKPEDVPAFGAKVVIHVTIPGEKAPFSLPGVVRWTRGDGMGVQFGLLGVRETRGILDVMRPDDSEEIKF